MFDTFTAPVLTPDLEASGHHWLEGAIAEALRLDAMAMSTMVLLNLPELLVHGQLPIAGEVHSSDLGGPYLMPQHAFNARQLLTLLLMGRTDLSRALRAAALDGFRDLTPETLNAQFTAMGGHPAGAGTRHRRGLTLLTKSHPRNSHAQPSRPRAD